MSTFAPATSPQIAAACPARRPIRFVAEDGDDGQVQYTVLPGTPGVEPGSVFTVGYQTAEDPDKDFDRFVVTYGAPWLGCRSRVVAGPVVNRVPISGAAHVSVERVREHLAQRSGSASWLRVRRADRWAEAPDATRDRVAFVACSLIEDFTQRDDLQTLQDRHQKSVAPMRIEAHRRAIRDAKQKMRELEAVIEVNQRALHRQLELVGRVAA